MKRQQGRFPDANKAFFFSVFGEIKLEDSCHNGTQIRVLQTYLVATVR